VRTVRFHWRVRPKARYDRSLALFRQAKELAPELPVKSGLMVGLGETFEVVAVLGDLRSSGVELVTIGQYLRPTLKHLPVERYVPPEEFAALREVGEQLGFAHVEAGPFVRSSYHAGEQAAAARS